MILHVANILRVVHLILDQLDQHLVAVQEKTKTAGNLDGAFQALTRLIVQVDHEVNPLANPDQILVNDVVHFLQPAPLVRTVGDGVLGDAGALLLQVDAEVPKLRCTILLSSSTKLIPGQNKK